MDTSIQETVEMFMACADLGAHNMLHDEVVSADPPVVVNPGHDAMAACELAELALLYVLHTTEAPASSDYPPDLQSEEARYDAADFPRRLHAALEFCGAFYRSCHADPGSNGIITLGCLIQELGKELEEETSWGRCDAAPALSAFEPHALRTAAPVIKAHIEALALDEYPLRAMLLAREARNLYQHVLGNAAEPEAGHFAHLCNLLAIRILREDSREPGIIGAAARVRLKEALGVMDDMGVHIEFNGLDLTD